KLATTVIGLLMLCAIQRASATTILDTIQGLPYDTGAPGGWDFSNSGGGHGQSLGLEFFLASPTAITGVEAYVSSQLANGRANFGIMADAGGVPSGSFITGDVSLVALGYSAPLTLNSLGWSLDPGTYWLVGVAISFEQGGWQANPTFDSIWAVDGATGNGTWFNNSVLPPPMALITGEATPLPAALPLFPHGLGALGRFGWRKRRRQQSLGDLKRNDPDAWRRRGRTRA